MTTTGGNPASPTGPEAVSRWRVHVLEKVFAAMFLLVLAILGVESLDSLRTGEWHALPALALAVLLQGVAAFARSLSPRTRAGIFGAASWIGLGTGLPVLGYALPNPLLVAAMTLTLLALCVSQRFALVNLAALVAILLGVAAYVSWVQPGYPQALLTQGQRILDQKHFLNWLRVIAVFTAVTLAVILSVGFLVRRLEDALAHNATLFGKLKAETEEKIEALEARHRLEAQAKRAHELQLLGLLAASVAHDFNNLLVVILSNASLLKDSADGHTHDQLDEIEQAGERAADLCRRLLTLGRERISEPEVVDLNQLIEAELPIVRTLASSLVHVDWRPGPPLWLECARTEMRQLLLNLCANARDAMPEGGRITITTERVERPNANANANANANGAFACLRIRDEGIGMDAATRRRIFEPFFTTKGKTKGTGLGLAVVSAAVEQHNGLLELESEPGRGTTFSLFFPLTDAPTHANGERDVTSLRPLAAPKTILVVDDDHAVRKVVGRCLENHGYTVLAAGDGDEALAILERSSVDLVISDAVMPKIDGRALFEAVSRDRPELPFLFCSGNALGTISARVLDEPHRALLSKPFSEEALLLKVQELLQAFDR